MHPHSGLISMFAVPCLDTDSIICVKFVFKFFKYIASLCNCAGQFVSIPTCSLCDRVRVLLGQKHRRLVFLQFSQSYVKFSAPVSCQWVEKKFYTIIVWVFNKTQMSRVMRKPTFCICENKDADQLRGNRETDQRLCFRYIGSTIPLLSKSEISSL